jgi:hypothetical protein
MKKKSIACLILVVGFIFLMSAPALADCTVTVNISSSSDPEAATHEVWYDPDNTVGGDEVMQGSGDMTYTQCIFTIPAPAPNDEVWILTKNAGATETFESAHVAVGGIAGSVTSTVIVTCTP